MTNTFVKQRMWPQTMSFIVFNLFALVFGLLARFAFVLFKVVFVTLHPSGKLHPLGSSTPWEAPALWVCACVTAALCVYACERVAMNEPPCLLFSHRAVLVLTRPASVLAPTLQRSGDSGCWLAEPDSGRLRPLCSPNGWWKSIKWVFYWNPVRLREQQRNPRSPGRVSEEQQSVSYIQNIHTDFLEMAAPQFPPAGVDLLVLLLSQFPVEDRGQFLQKVFLWSPSSSPPRAPLDHFLPPFCLPDNHLHSVTIKMLQARGHVVYAALPSCCSWCPYSALFYTLVMK